MNPYLIHDIIKEVRNELYGRKLVKRQEIHREHFDINLEEDIDHILEACIALSDDVLKKNLLDPVKEKVKLRRKLRLSDIDILKACILIAAHGRNSSPGFGWPYQLMKPRKKGMYKGIVKDTTHAKHIIESLSSLRFLSTEEELIDPRDEKRKGTLMNTWAGVNPQGQPFRVRKATKKLYSLLYSVLKNYEYFSKECRYICAAILFREKDDAVLLLGHHRKLIENVDIDTGTIPFYLPGPPVTQKLFFDEEKSKGHLKEFLENVFSESDVKIDNKVYEDECGHGKPHERLRIRAYAAKFKKDAKIYLKPTNVEFEINFSKYKGFFTRFFPKNFQEEHEPKGKWVNIFDAIRTLPHKFSRDMLVEYALQIF